MPLNDTQIKAAKPTDKPYKLIDGGLYLEIFPAGSYCATKPDDLFVGDSPRGWLTS